MSVQIFRDSVVESKAFDIKKNLVLTLIAAWNLNRDGVQVDKSLIRDVIVILGFAFDQLYSDY